MNVVYEDNHLLVVIKPYGVPSQADRTGDNDLLSQGKAYIAQKYHKPGAVYLGLVHRLDRPTSGLMVFARTSKAAARLSAQIKNRSFEKTYLAVLTAPPPNLQGTLRDYLVKDQKKHTVRIVQEGTTGAKQAVLDYKLLAESGGLYLVRIRLLTGRFHQIRAQFAARGAAVYGDMKYGPRAIKAPLALFAAELRFAHPTTGEMLSFSVKPDFHPFTLFDL